MAGSARLRLVTLALVLATLLAFSPALENGFVLLDDTHFISGNPAVREGLTAHGVAWAFRTTERGNWIPLARLAHMANVEMFGLWPGGHHLASILAHAGAAAVLLRWLAAATGKLWVPAFAAALFALHPLRVESVAWAAELKDVLSGLLFMLCLLAHRRWAAARSARSYAALLAAFALGLLAKPMLVTLPLVLLILDAWPLGRWRRGATVPLLLEKLPLLAMAAAAGAVALSAQAGTGAVGSLAQYPVAVRLGTAALAAAGYLGDFLVPAGLSPFYPHPGAGTGVAASLAAALLLAAVTIAAAAAARRQPWLAAGWAWYLVVLLPVSGILQTGFQLRADRYSYLPLVGIAIAVAAGAGTLAGHRRLRKPVVAAAALFLLACGLLTPGQVRLWRDTRTLFAHAAALDRGNWLAHLKLGETARAESDPAGALPHLERAVALAPENFHARTLLGTTLGELGRHDAARRELEAAVRLAPGWPDARHNLAVALANSGRLVEARLQLEAELRLRPGSGRARAMLERVDAALGPGAAP